VAKQKILEKRDCLVEENQTLCLQHCRWEPAALFTTELQKTEDEGVASHNAPDKILTLLCHLFRTCCPQLSGLLLRMAEISLLSSQGIEKAPLSWAQAAHTRISWPQLLHTRRAQAAIFKHHPVDTLS